MPQGEAVQTNELFPIVYRLSQLFPKCVSIGQRQNIYITFDGKTREDEINRYIRQFRKDDRNM